jgi:hypothetical protein
VSLLLSPPPPPSLSLSHLYSLSSTLFFFFYPLLLPLSFPSFPVCPLSFLYPSFFSEWEWFSWDVILTLQVIANASFLSRFQWVGIMPVA